ncbi:MAG: hypothetical protein HQL66_14795, partial [Magnetococcales bacterium]|nr:hypothetical protein [Magnetococcales bacterium]
RESSAETDRKFQETDRKFQETDRKFQETDRRFQETERQIKEAILEMRRDHQETERGVRETSRKVGQLGGRWGEFVEGMVAPACKTLFIERGIPVHKVHSRTKASLPGNRHMEIDLLVIDDTVIVAVEVKSELRAEDVRHHLDRLVEFKEFYPEYVDRRIMGAVAGIVMGEGVVQFAMKQGLYVIVQSGESVRLVNDKAFEPRVW